MLKEAIILAGGTGTRLKSVVEHVPKPMASVHGKPFLHYLFEMLKKESIESVVLSVGYKHEIIQDYFKDEYLGISVKYAVEDRPLGTGGGIKLAFDKIVNDRFFVLNGDTYFDIPLHQLTEEDSLCVIAAKELSDFERYGTMNIAQSRKVTAFNEKKYCKKGFINAGVYCMHESVFSSIKEDSFSFETEILEPLSNRNQLKAVVFDSYFKDIGIPEDYAQFQKDLKTILNK